MNTKHTPDPWFYDARNRSVIARGRTVCDIPHRDVQAVHDGRLIAAAPQLLAALKLLYEHCRLYYPEVERNNVGEAVRAAISEAEGS